MQTRLTLTLSTLFLFLMFTSPTFFSCTAAAARNNKHDEQQDLVRSSCMHARYPRVCLRTLSNYSGPTNTPADVAQAALKVSLAHARRASGYLKTLGSSSTGSFGESKRQRAALRDCAEQMADSVEELSKSLEELRHLRPEKFRWQMSDAQTWVSAALTDSDSCLDGFGGGDGDGDDEGKVKRDVRRRVTDVARVTSNALYMINRLDQGGIGKGKPKPKPKPKPKTRRSASSSKK